MYCWYIKWEKILISLLSDVSLCEPLFVVIYFLSLSWNNTTGSKNYTEIFSTHRLSMN